MRCIRDMFGMWWWSGWVCEGMTEKLTSGWKLDIYNGWVLYGSLNWGLWRGRGCGSGRVRETTVDVVLFLMDGDTQYGLLGGWLIRVVVWWGVWGRSVTFRRCGGSKTAPVVEEDGNEVESCVRWRVFCVGVVQVGFWRWFGRWCGMVIRVCGWCVFAETAAALEGDAAWCGESTIRDRVDGDVRDVAGSEAAGGLNMGSVVSSHCWSSFARSFAISGR